MSTKPRDVKLKPGMTLAEYTTLKLAAETEAAALEIAKDPEQRQRALEIARRIAVEEFEDAFHFTSRADAQLQDADQVLSAADIAERERVAALKKARAKRTLKLIADTRYKDLYTMVGERQLLTDAKLKLLLKDADGHKLDFTKSVRALAQLVGQRISDALFGCEVYVGICKDASATVLDFVGQQGEAYARRDTKGLHSSFECFETKDLVVQAVLGEGIGTAVGLAGGTGGRRKHTPSQMPSAAAPSSSQPAPPSIMPGETVVFVPLMGKRGPVGVVEIHGLVTEGLTDLGQYRRTNTLIQVSRAVLLFAISCFPPTPTPTLTLTPQRP